LSLEEAPSAAGVIGAGGMLQTGGFEPGQQPGEEKPGTAEKDKKR